MDRGVLILALTLAIGAIMLMMAAVLSSGERACPQVALRTLAPNPITGPVRMLPEIVR